MKHLTQQQINPFDLTGKVALVTGGASGIGTVLFFASPAARYVTNQVLSVDGGWSVTCFSLHLRLQARCAWAG